METIKLYTNYNIKVNVFISDFNEYQCVENFTTTTNELFKVVNKYLDEYQYIHQALHHIELNENECNIYLYQY